MFSLISYLVNLMWSNLEYLDGSAADGSSTFCAVATASRDEPRVSKHTGCRWPGRGARLLLLRGELPVFRRERPSAATAWINAP